MGVRRKTALRTDLEAWRLKIPTMKVVIADPSSIARSSIFRILCELGAKPFQVVLCSDFKSAAEEIRKGKVDLVFSEFNLGKHCGLELLEVIRETPIERRNTIFILLTANSSQSAVARAAEEDVDAYLLKPFTPDTVRNAIIRTISARTNPPAYLAEIEAGREKLSQGLAELAEKHFSEALKLDAKPALACYYLGLLQDKKQVEEQAKVFYEEGLKHNRLHYKCLISLYELYQRQGKYAQAYELSKRISEFFPASPKRLVEALRLMIHTQSFDDIDRYYDFFLGVDERDENLISHMCAGLVICGKHALKTGRGERAIDLFQRAAVTCGSRLKILREIVQALIDHRLAGEAESFLRRFPAEAQKSEEYAMLDFQISNLVYPPSVILARGRELMAQGLGDERFYEIMVARALEARIAFAAENFAFLASAKFPEHSEKFENMVRSIRRSSARPER